MDPASSPFTRRAALQGALGLAAAGSLTGLAAPAYAEQSETLGHPHPGGCPVDPRLPRHQLRSVWLASVDNIDFPSKPGLTAEQQRAELIGWLDLARASKHNAITFQVRPTADSFWPGAKEPWSQWLSGTQGRDPGWDPLGTAVTEAHARNLQLHAWFNPFRVAMTEDPGTLNPEHPARKHPEWVIPYGGKLYYNPGLPEVRAFVIDTIMDAVCRYDLDAVHFDDYFYPYPVKDKVFDDAAAFGKYGRGKSLEDWRRANITALMTDLQRAIKRAKPWVQLGVSPFGVWRNKDKDPKGSDTTAGATTYDDLYADTRAWVRDGVLDYICPQIYWSRGFAAADYEKLVSWWSETVRGARCNLYIGEAVYKVAKNSDPSWNKPEELSSHLDFTTRFPQVQGNFWFSAKDVREDRLAAMAKVNQTWYSHEALVPRMPWLVSRAPRPVRLRRRGDTLSWKGVPGAVTYAVHRVEGRHPQSADLADARNLVATLPRGAESWRDPQSGGGSVTYLVTAVDRLGNESPAACAR